MNTRIYGHLRQPIFLPIGYEKLLEVKPQLKKDCIFGGHIFSFFGRSYFVRALVRIWNLEGMTIIRKEGKYIKVQLRIHFVSPIFQIFDVGLYFGYIRTIYEMVLEILCRILLCVLQKGNVLRRKICYFLKEVFKLLISFVYKKRVSKQVVLVLQYILHRVAFFYLGWQISPF